MVDLKVIGSNNIYPLNHSKYSAINYVLCSKWSVSFKHPPCLLNGQRKRTNTQCLPRMKKKLPGTEKEMKRGDQLSGIINKEKNTTEQTNLNIEKR